MKKILVLAALVMFVFALVVATGQDFVTTWQVWVSAGLVAWVADRILADAKV